MSAQINNHHFCFI